MSYTYRFPRPSVTLDVALFRLESGLPEILLIQRRSDPFRRRWALPGGFLDMEEELEEAARRELLEETSLEAGALQSFGVYGTVGRDPRGRTITVAYLGILPRSRSQAVAGDDASDARWFSLHELPELAFDHHQIIADAAKALWETMSRLDWAAEIFGLGSSDLDNARRCLARGGLPWSRRPPRSRPEGEHSS